MLKVNMPNERAYTGSYQWIIVNVYLPNTLSALYHAMVLLLPSR